MPDRDLKHRKPYRLQKDAEGRGFLTKYAQGSREFSTKFAQHHCGGCVASF
jgi:hypothetical protein